MIVAVSSYHFPLDFLLDLDILSFDRLMGRAQDARNSQIRENAVAMRVAFNGDQKQFEEFFESLLPTSQKEAIQERKIADGHEKLKKMFGG